MVSPLKQSIDLIKKLKSKKVDKLEIMLTISKRFGNKLSTKELEEISILVLK